MRRGSIIAAIVAATVLPTFAALPAAAGGGCHEQSEGSGDAVVIEDACFTPSILHVEAGDTVGFENNDPFEHNLYGTGWGSGTLAPDRGVRMTFDGDGLFPFQCTIHPGMTGVIVVGDGDGPGNGATVAMGPAAPAEPPAAAKAPPSSGSALPAGAIGLLLGIAIALGASALLRSRARSAGAPAVSSP
jgi:plastocyanin